MLKTSLLLCTALTSTLCLANTTAVTATTPATTASPYNSAEAKKYFEAKISFEVGSQDVKEIIEQLKKEAADKKTTDTAKAATPDATKTATPDAKQPAKGKTVIVDLRDAESFKKGHIPLAVNVPNGDIKDTNLFSKDDTVIVYCYKADCHLAANVAVKWVDQGYKVREFQGGFDHWEKTGNEVVKEDDKKSTDPKAEPKAEDKKPEEKK